MLADIDDAFQVKEIAKKANKEPAKTDSSSSPTAITILSEKRAQNVMIFLGTLRQINLDGLIEAIRTFDDSKISEGMLKQCKVSLPTLEEEKQLIGFDLNSNIRTAEMFMIKMSGMYRYRQRIDALTFKLGFWEQFQHLKLVRTCCSIFSNYFHSCQLFNV